MFVFLASALRHLDKYNLFLMFSALRFAVIATWGQNTGARDDLRQECMVVSPLAFGSITCLSEHDAGIGFCSSKVNGKTHTHSQTCNLSLQLNNLSYVYLGPT